MGNVLEGRGRGRKVLARGSGENFRGRGRRGRMDERGTEKEEWVSGRWGGRVKEEEESEKEKMN